MLKSKQTAPVDDYIAKASSFAQPILNHLRALIHKACPGVEETIKWSRPFFEYRSAIIGNMSAFKEHCSFGFWGEEMGALLREAGVLGEDGMGSFGRIKSLSDLPPDKAMLEWIRKAAGFIENGQHISPISARQRVVKKTPAETELPEAFSAALKKNQKAAKVFAAFSPSGQREYVDWIADAKRAETRDKRIASAVEWIEEGKQRNWQYEKC